MDNTRDMDLVYGSRGMSMWMTDIKDIPEDLFKQYVRGKSFLDLGAGDGRILSLAMRCGAKKFKGIEIDDLFLKTSPMQRHMKKLNFYYSNPSEFEVLYYYLGSFEVPVKNQGEPDFVEHLKDFVGTVIVYFRKVEHRLEKFNENMLGAGFREVEKDKYVIVYRRDA